VLGHLIEAAGFGVCIESSDRNDRWNHDWDGMASRIASRQAADQSDWLDRIGLLL
jgi:hypothetical protein